MLVPIYIEDRDIVRIEEKGWTNLYPNPSFCLEFDGPLNPDHFLDPDLFPHTDGEDPAALRNPLYWYWRAPDNWDDEPRWVMNEAAEKKVNEYYASRFVPGYWSVNSGPYVYVFKNVEALVFWIEKDPHQYLIRDPQGKSFKRKVTVTLEKCEKE